MKILVTGFAGFIGNALGLRLAAAGHEVTGIDNINSYYDPRLKIERLRRSGIDVDSARGLAMAVPATGSRREAVSYPDLPWGVPLGSSLWPGLRFMRLDITSREGLQMLFASFRPEVVVNLAAQAGVRYSIESPHSYIESNIDGFANLLECCRHNATRHLVYASSSSVYGANTKVPFAESDRVDSPVSLYAATKKSNEMMAAAYSRLYGFKTTGLRYFTVYGPWGRPDMAPMLFSDAILEGRPIKVFNHGDMSRDFTYIDDIVEGTARVAEGSPEGKAPVYNIGCGHPESLMLFITELERAIGGEARKEMLPMQPGDVATTWADTSLLTRDYGYQPRVGLHEGIARFAEWRLEWERYMKNDRK